MLCAMYDLALLQLCRPVLGRSLEESRGLIDKVESRYKILLTPLDLRVLKIRSLKAMFLLSSRNFDKALELYQQCMEDCYKALQPGHPHMLATMSNFAMLYWKRGQRDKSLELYDRCIKLQLQHIGMGHEYTIMTFKNAARLKMDMGDCNGACEDFRATAEGYEAIYGLAHPQTLSMFREVQRLYRILGQHIDARGVAEKIVEGERALKAGL
jgi:tetratricopeptide (TPR) repeat protein